MTTNQTPLWQWSAREVVAATTSGELSCEEVARSGADTRGMARPYESPGERGLPSGVQFVGSKYREDVCLDAAQAVEDACGWLAPVLWGRAG